MNDALDRGLGNAESLGNVAQRIALSHEIARRLVNVVTLGRHAVEQTLLGGRRGT